MAETRGTWSLSEAWSEKGSGEWIPTNEVYVDDSETSHGFWLGGPNKSDFDKIVYATDTLSTPTSNLGSPSNPYLAVANNDVHAFISGPGISPSNDTYKHTLSADTLSVSPGLDGIYPSANALVAAGTKTTGWYFSGSGWDMNKVDFSSETKVALPSIPTLPQGITNRSSVASNQQMAAISPGSDSDSSSNKVIKFIFANDTTMSYGWTLAASNSKQGALDAGADGNSGFMIGGATHKTRVEKIDFISDTAAVLPGSNMAGSRYGSGSNSQGTTAGYIAGGEAGFYPSPTPSASYKADKMPFSTLTMAQIPGVPATLGRINVRSYSGSSHALPSVDPSYKIWSTDEPQGPGAGYKTMGWNSNSNSSGNGYSSTEKISLILDYCKDVPGGNSAVKMGGGSSFSNGTDGFSATGIDGLGPQPSAYMRSYVIKFNYSTETSSSLDSYPGGAMTESAGFGGPTYGYHAGGSQLPGGQNQNLRNDVSKFNYSSNTWSTAPSCTYGKACDANLQTSTHAWRFGGWYHTPSEPSGSVDRMSWSSETWELQPSWMPQPSPWGPFMSRNCAGNESKGYIASQYHPGTSNLTKIDYAASTFTAGTNPVAWLWPSPSPGAKWSTTRGLSTRTKGAYVGGGWQPGPLNPFIGRWDFATEMMSSWGGNDGMDRATFNHYTFGPEKVGQAGLRPAKPLVNSKNMVLNPALTIPTHCYFSTGNPWGNNNPDKLNFSNNTASSVPGQNIRLYEGAAFSSPTHWYYTAGKRSPGYPQANTSTYKIQYSNDTTTNNVSTMPVNTGWPFDNNRGWTPFSDHSGGKGYISGGYFSPGSTPFATVSHVYKLTYATDAWTNCEWAHLGDAGGWWHAWGRSNGLYGYRLGGAGAGIYPSSQYRSLEGTLSSSKLDFSNETWIPVPSANVLEDGVSPSGGNSAGITYGTATDAYLGGGSGDGNGTSRVQKLTYSSETIAFQPANLLSKVSGNQRNRAASSTTHGYRGGSYSGAGSNISKYEFSTGVEVANPSHFAANSYNNIGSSVQEDVGGYSASPNTI